LKENTYKILAVDDNPTNLRVISQLLKELGVEILKAENGFEALEIAVKEQPMLILLDIMMPEMDGYEVCKRLKTDKETKDIPVMFITAKFDSENVVFAFEAGAVDYVVKPFNPAELIARVRTHLDLKIYQEQLKKMNLELENLNAEKNEFLGIVAHDLKNPIYNISMITKAIMGDEKMSREDVMDFCGDIITSADKMLLLITNLLDVNAIEQGKSNINPENLEIDLLVNQIVSEYEERALNKGIKIYTNFDLTGSSVYADKNATMQVFDNLISNSVKYSPFNKNVFVNVQNTESSVRIEFQDEGPGIHPDEMHKLFGKYSKLSNKPTADESSTGLGLSIVKKYVESMNGSVWCESELGVGTKFIVELPKPY